MPLLRETWSGGLLSGLPSTQIPTSQLTVFKGSSKHCDIDMSSTTRRRQMMKLSRMTCSKMPKCPRSTRLLPRAARSPFPLECAKGKGIIDLLRLRENKSRPCRLLPEMIPESAPGPTIPGPPKTPGTVDGDASGTCSPVGVALGTVNVGLKTLKNSQAKLCTARMARMPQR
jgi:hypothetical protein